MKKILLLMILLTLSEAKIEDCDKLYVKVNELVEIAKDHSDDNRTISQANALDDADYYIKQYLKCVDKNLKEGQR